MVVPIGNSKSGNEIKIAILIVALLLIAVVGGITSAKSGQLNIQAQTTKTFNDTKLLPAQTKAIPQASRYAKIYKEFLNADSNNVMVVAHRGDWRNAPENSLQAVQNCINMGIDIVEIDVRKTKDDRLVLMHDSTINRTTTGKGHVSRLTLKEIQQFYLKNSDGTVSKHKVPTLDEVMLLVKGKCMVNLDKAYGIMAECYDVLKQTDTIKHAIFKGSSAPENVQAKLKQIGEDIVYMQLVSCKGRNGLTVEQVYSMIDQLKPPAIEILIDNDKNPIMKPAVLAAIRKKGCRVWINTLWNSISGGHSDPAPGKAPTSWDWHINRGVNMLQTDRPKRMLNYLRKKKLHS